MTELPWGSLRIVSTTTTDYTMAPNKYSVKLLLQELFAVLERKLRAAFEEENQVYFTEVFTGLSFFKSSLLQSSF